MVEVGERGRGAGGDLPAWRLALHETRRLFRQCDTANSTASVPMTGCSGGCGRLSTVVWSSCGRSRGCEGGGEGIPANRA